MSNSIKNKLDNLSRLEEKLSVKKMMLVEKAMKGDSPGDLIKAKQVLGQLESNATGQKKSFIVDWLVSKSPV